MAAAGAVVAETLAVVEERLEPGITMIELDRIADEYIRSRGAVPTSKGYKGYPAATCISPNDMIVHGIPGRVRGAGGRHHLRRRRRDEGRHDRRLLLPRSRSARSRAEAQRLLDVCRAALEAGIEAAQLGSNVGRHLRRRADRRRGRRLLGRPQPRRPRRRQALPRGSAGAELRHRVPRPRAARGHDARDRADDHRRRRPRCTSTTTSGRSRPSTARSRRTSSTRSRSPRTARAC